MAASAKWGGPEPAGAVVTMNVYSGRPDPKFELSADELSQLLARIDALTAADDAPSRPRLGYRGLSVRFSDGRLVEIADGRITPPSGGALADPGRAVERWLVMRAGDRLDAKLVETALQRIDATK